MNRKDCEYHAFNSDSFTGKDHTDMNFTWRDSEKRHQQLISIKPVISIICLD